MGANPEIVRKFLDQLEQVLPDLISNCNESGCQDVPKEDEVIGESGVPQYCTVPKEQRETSTILTMTPQNIRAGFREMSTCPFNPLLINPAS